MTYIMNCLLLSESTFLAVLDAFALMFDFFLKLLKVSIVLISDRSKHFLIDTASLCTLSHRVAKGATLFAMYTDIFFLKLIISWKLLVPGISDLKLTNARLSLKMWM